MLRRLRTLILTLLVALSLSPALLVASPVAAVNVFNPVCNSGAANESTACKTTGQDPIGGRNGILYKVAAILSIIAAIGAVIVIIIAGFMYVTSGGDANKAGSARKAIIGAVVGLVVIALANAFIAFVINIVK
ncbi:MAG TPA: hypothetical protein VLI54_02665 [Bacillota bacterium]|nr:hypothetical protein [Bacillota bacterium]